MSVGWPRGWAVACSATAVIIKKLRVPAFSKYLEDVDYADEVPESTEVPTKNMAVPKDKEYHQAVNAIAAMGAKYLSQWPGWSRHFAKFMCYEMGAEFHDVCEWYEYMDETQDLVSLDCVSAPILEKIGQF